MMKIAPRMLVVGVLMLLSPRAGLGQGTTPVSPATGTPAPQAQDAGVTYLISLSEDAGGLIVRMPPTIGLDQPSRFVASVPASVGAVTASYWREWETEGKN